jgi:hypothetical protein
MSIPDEPADFLKVPMADGGSRTLLARFTDGTVLCCICFGRFRMDELNPVEGGRVEDVCKQCAADEMRELERRA